MKENKKLKFSFLIVAMISLSLLLAMIPTTFNFIINSRGVMTSYMHEDKKVRRKSLMNTFWGYNIPNI